MKAWFRRSVTLCLFAGAAFAADEDAYYTYVKNAPEFQPVKQDPGAWTNRWNTWVYMPWRFKWTIGTGNEGGQFCQDYGFNGGFTDHGNTRDLPWLDKWNLRFYNDHTAEKGYLHLGAGQSFIKYAHDPRVIRTGYKGKAPLDAEMLAKLKGFVSGNVNGLKKSPNRIAYALDDEISIGSFMKPLAWRLNGDDAAYEKWLDGYYGRTNHPPAQYVTADILLPQYNRKLADLDFSPLLDRVCYNDSVWANFLGALVECSNAADPETPCGFVGGQSPNTWGGFDYAKITKKIQFVEAYLGTAQSIIRSLGPTIPQVTTHGHGGDPACVSDIWQMWWCIAHGNRGMIGWVDGWFDGPKPRKWLEQWKAPNRELGTVIGPKVAGAKWIHDGVAIYYSQPSMQCSWCLDIEPHGDTWANRGSDDGNGTWHLVRQAWEKILTDSGLQYNWISYDQVVLGGVPKEYKVLILPANYALSDIEAKRIRDFVEAGGTVVADFACGLFDQHGKGRSKGALDDVFGVTHDGRETKTNFFAGKLWVETDQEAGFNAGMRKRLETLSPKMQDDFAVAETKLPTKNVKKFGQGTAAYLNLSPQRYLMYRGERKATDAQRAVFVAPILASGVKPWVTVTSQGKRPPLLEATYFSRDGRTFVFVVQNASASSTELGDVKVEGFPAGHIPLDVAFPAAVKDAIDERTGKKLGDGKSFTFDFNLGEAVVLSFAGEPPR